METPPSTENTEEPPVDRNPFPVCMRWIKTSPSLLQDAENKLLNRLQSRVTRLFVPVFLGSWTIRTIIADNQSSTPPVTDGHSPKTESNIPLVMVHGFASGLALWCKNVDAFAAKRTVYAFDVLGFGRSSRPKFPTDPIEAEQQFISSIEAWRTVMKLDRFILLGHSLGGYLCTVYAMAHPQHIAHLILVDPWGFFEAPFDEELIADNPGWQRSVRAIKRLTQLTTPLALLRAAGPLGRRIIHHFRQDLRGFFDQRIINTGQSMEVPDPSLEAEARYGLMNFSHRASSIDAVLPSEKNSSNGDETVWPLNELIDCVDLDGSAALDYVYHINVQKPSGELGFKALCSSYGWVHQPLIPRLSELDASIPITFIYGSRSWMDLSSGVKTRMERPNSYVDIKIIEGAGHQVYAQASEEFNQFVIQLAARVDSDDIPKYGFKSGTTEPVNPITNDQARKRCSSQPQQQNGDPESSS